MIVNRKHSHLVHLLVETLGNAVLHSMYLVGHSLGAHVVGFLAKRVQTLGLGKLPWITGLDPALPLYWGQVEHLAYCPLLPYIW